MKEVKKFFDIDNRLNKGYSDDNISNETNHSLYRKRFENIFPPVDIIEAYENLYPGATEQLLKLAEQEQAHRHKLEKNSLVINERSKRLGTYFGLIIILVIAYVSLELFKLGKNLQAVIFSLTAYGAIFGISLLNYLKNLKLQDKKHHGIINENYSSRRNKSFVPRQVDNKLTTNNPTKRRRYN